MGKPVGLGISEVALVALYPDLLVTVLGNSGGDSVVSVLFGLGFGLSRVMLINTDEPFMHLVFSPQPDKPLVMSSEKYMGYSWKTQFISVMWDKSGSLKLYICSNY